MKDSNHAPKGIEFQASDSSSWETAVEGECKREEEVEIFSFEPARAERWKLTIHNTYGKKDEGAIINRVRFHGRLV